MLHPCIFNFFFSFVGFTNSKPVKTYTCILLCIDRFVNRTLTPPPQFLYYPNIVIQRKYENPLRYHNVLHDSCIKIVVYKFGLYERFVIYLIIIVSFTYFPTFPFRRWRVHRNIVQLVREMVFFSPFAFVWFFTSKRKTTSLLCLCRRNSV